MRTRITERDLSRIVRRVIKEQETTNDTQTNVADPTTVTQMRNFNTNLQKLTGIDSKVTFNVSKILFGLYYILDPNTQMIWKSYNQDLETRLKNYDRFVTKNSLTLPSSDMIKLFKEIV
jgi:hypothetical protein